MILPRGGHDPASVATHYDVLDRFYRELWGEHVHHGLWAQGVHTSPERATRALLDRVIARAGLRPGATVCDVGCGYGGTARVLVREHGARVTALTISRAQWQEARARGGGPSYLLRDWLENGVAPESCDAVVAIESLSHMADKARAFAECARVLRPGGRLVVCDWLAAERPAAWEERLLLEPICREGRLPSLASAHEYRDLMAAAGLAVEGWEDVSREGRHTWAVVGRRALRRLACDREARRLLLGPQNPDRAFAFSLIRIPLAYTTRSMRLGILVATKRPFHKADRTGCDHLVAPDRHS